MITLSRITIGLALMMLNLAAYAKPQIIVSSSPLASIVLMIVGDDMDVVTINTEGSCPHHYHARPSDRLKFQNAAMMIYIDDNFDSYMPNMFKNYLGIKLKVSDIPEVKIKIINGDANWHFWLDLDNVLAFQIALAEKIKVAYPGMDTVISENLAVAREKIFELSLLKKAELQNLDELILLSDSVEYFFTDIDAKLIKLYQQENLSLKYLSDLEETIKDQYRQCLVIDQSQDPKSYQRFNKKIIQIDSENWNANKEIRNDGSLFFVKYLDIINKLKDCRQ